MFIENSSLDEWLDTLKPYQQSTIRALTSSNDEVEVAKKWLSAQERRVSLILFCRVLE